MNALFSDSTGTSDKFAMIGLSLDDTVDAPKRFVEKRAIPSSSQAWPAEGSFPELSVCLCVSSRL